MNSTNQVANTVSNRLRVMMVLPKYPYPVAGGLERQAHELGRALQSKSVDVQVVSSRFNATDDAFELVENIPVYRIPLPSNKFIRFLLSPFFLSWRLFKLRHSYDVVHLHQFGWFCLFGIIASKFLKKPTITKLPNVGERGIPGLQTSLMGRLMLSILLCSDAIVAMSRESASELSQVGYPSSRVLLTPNGINIERYPFIQRNNKHNQKAKVVYVGRLMPQKGVDNLLYAWHILAERGIDANLEIWGDGPMLEELQQLAEKLLLTSSVKFSGHVANVISKLGQMDIFVLPSFLEGNSNAILEAMLAGLPIVASKVGGAEMQVGKEGAHLLFEPNNMTQLADILAELIENPDIRVELGAKMNLRVRQHFDINLVADTYISAYHLLANGCRNQIAKSGNPVVMEG